MKVTKREGAAVRRILVGMIVDDVVCSRIAGRFEPELFAEKYANLIAKWCVDYFNRYGTAPREAIASVFESWCSRRTRDEDTVELVEKLLESLSGEYEAHADESNSEHLIDYAAEHFNRVKLKRLSEQIAGDIDSGEVEEATKRINSFTRMEMGAGAGVDVMFDADAIRQAFEDKKDPLIVYPGALGNFFRDALERDAFVAIMAPEKRGKTWWLLELAFAGMEQRRRVAFFEVGDMSQNQIMRRFMIRCAGRPLKPKTIKVPRFLNPPEMPDAACEVDFDEKEFEKHLSWRLAFKRAQKIMRARVKSNDSLLKLSVHPCSTLSVAGMRGILQTWQRERNWVPDVIVVDYADILAAPAGVKDSREAINQTWQGLRALSQEYHCLVVTATQADAESYNVSTLGRRNFSEDKRKFAHVTGMLGLNATDDEKERQLQRLNWLVLREDEFVESHCVHVAGCLSIGKPHILSTF